MAHQDRFNIAVFIDFDNIEIGVKSTLGEHFDVGSVLEAIKERGEVVTKIAYADWTRAGEYSRALTQHAIRLVQRNLTPGGDKNGADINLALDALEMAFTHPHINAYVIVGGDSDFLTLVEKLKQYDKKVFVVGGRAFTSVILQRNCHEFIAYENLMRKPIVRGGRAPAPVSVQPISQAFALVRRALKILADREVSPQTGLLKSTLLQLDSTFSERSYGASSFLDFTEKLQQAGLVLLKHSGRSVMVELNPSFDEGSAPPVPLAPTTDVHLKPAEESSGGEAGHDISAPGSTQAAVEPAGDNAEGVRLAANALRSAANARWPMYIRNFKQILRAAAIDERRYGFGGLMDLLRACQREGLLRTERDRRGGLRVFQGPALSAGMPAPGHHAPMVDSEDMAVEAAPAIGEGEADAIVTGNVVDYGTGDETDEQMLELLVPPPTIVDTTAELLGRSKPKRTRAASPSGQSATSGTSGNRRTAAARKPATRRPSRSRKTRDAS